jgi:hypothetical protein
MSLDKVSKAEQILGALAAFLVIDLLFLPWFEVSFGPITASTTGTGAPDGWLGVLGMLGAVAYVADLALEKFSGTELPMIGGSRQRTRLMIALFTAACVALKFVFHLNHVGDTAVGCWLAIIAAGGLAFLSLKPETLS